MQGFVRLAGLVLAFTTISAVVSAQSVRGVVVDQTGLPLPGVRVEVYRGGNSVENVTSDAEGQFDLAAGAADDTIEVALEGFETVHVTRAAASRVVLPLARATEVTEVVGSALTSSGSSMEHLGSTMAAPLAQKLPAARPRILQSLPLLPSVVRGQDGLLRIGGTRPAESSLWIDGFDVTDPVSLTTAIDLPNESVKGMAVVRDPVSATFSGVLGSMASIETTAGTGEFRAGIQGFIPRPRLNERYGLGRIEAFYPRAYGSGHIGKKVRFFGSTELNFERVPVPGVTTSSGTPAAGASGVTSFARVDIDLATHNTLTVEGLFLPAKTSYSGLSPLQQPASAPNVSSTDLFGGVIDRVVLGTRDLVTLRFGVMHHETGVDAAGTGPAVLRPDGWQQNWFSAVDTTGDRESASITWDRAGIIAAGTHTFSLTADVQQRSMSSTMNHQTIQIQDDLGRLLRSITFAPVNQPIVATDAWGGAGARDLWDLTPRLQVDLDLRIDWFERFAQLTPSPRIGFRYVLDESARTTLKASVGRYVGRYPLGAGAFNQFPTRLDQSFDPNTGAVIQSTTNVFSRHMVELPRADGVSIELERSIRPGLDAQAAVRVRNGSELPTVSVTTGVPLVLLQSSGTSTYRELQLSVRQQWSPAAQMFISYVHSDAQGEMNDYGTLYTNLDTPLLEPGANTAAPASVPDRLRAWGTVALPWRVVVSPAIDWRTGFPYSLQDEYRHFIGTPNSLRLPPYFSLDLTTFKTFDLFRQKMDLGLQTFNLTNHFNPRDVIAVVGSPLFGTLTNSVGVTFGGYMQIRW